VGRRLLLEQDGGSPKGYQGWLFDRPLMLFWAVGLSLPWVAATRGVFYSFLRVLIVLVLLSLDRGVFPRY
jgi:hypothetical protein